MCTMYMNKKNRESRPFEKAQTTKEKTVSNIKTLRKKKIEISKNADNLFYMLIM